MRARDPDAPRWEWDATLRQVVLAYRGDPALGPLVLDLLKPAMARWLRFLDPEPPVIRRDDLEQQTVLEVLEAASSMPLPPDMRFVDKAIVRRARRPVARWLFSEASYKDWTEPFPEDDEEDDDEGDTNQHLVRRERRRVARERYPDYRRGFRLSSDDDGEGRR
jgi:hypothetical protein